MRHPRRSIPTAILMVAMAWTLPAPGVASPHPEGETASEADEQRQRDYYDQGTNALDESDLREAEKWFAKAAKLRGSRSAGAMYWLAYAQSRQGNRKEALENIKALRAQYPDSRWIDDARALEVELGARAGKPYAPENEEDENLKLYALQALQNADPERAVPLLMEFLDGNHSPRLKEQALFVLVQSGEPAARTKVMEIARGKANPHLQRKAIEYLATFDEGPEVSRFLGEIYRATADRDVKRSILQGYMVSDNVKALEEVARTESDPRLRRDAIHTLGTQDATEELEALYRAGASEEDRVAILEALAIADSPDLLIEIARSDPSAALRVKAIHGLGIMDSAETGEALASIYRERHDKETRRAVLEAWMMQDNAQALLEAARTESEPALRESAIHSLGAMDSSETGDALLGIYRANTDKATRAAVLDAFMMQDNARALIAIAREEKDPEMRRRAVERLANVDSEEATEFLIGILKEE